jgi:hypothetical protein
MAGTSVLNLVSENGYRPYSSVSVGVLGVALIAASLYDFLIPAPLLEDTSVTVQYAIGGGLLLIAFLLAVFRNGCRIDVEANELQRWWGLPAPLVIRRYPLDKFNEVQMTRFLYRGTARDVLMTWPVRLVGGGYNVVVCTANTVPAAWRRATRIAEFLDLTAVNKIDPHKPRYDDVDPILERCPTRQGRSF